MARKSDSKIIKDVKAAAEWVAQAFQASGYKADFSPESFKEIERFFDEHSEEGSARPGGLLSEDTGLRLFAIGSYIGETLRRNIGGKWEGRDDDPEAEINVQLILPDGTVLWPIQQVIKRFKTGKEESIVAYGISMGLKIE